MEAKSELNEAKLLATVQSQVRRLRVAQGLTQEALAEKARLSVDMVSRIERGTRVPGILVLARLARALGTGLDSVLRECGNAAGPGHVPVWRSSFRTLGDLLDSPTAKCVPCPPGCEDAVFAFRVESDDMRGSGLFPGDWVFVNSDVPPSDGDIVICEVEEALTLRRYRRAAGHAMWVAENPFAPTLVKPHPETPIWGVVVGMSRNL